MSEAKKEVKKEKTESEKVAAVKQKADKFRELASKRVNAAVAKIRLLGNLSGSGYSSSKEQHDKIVNALQEAVDSVYTKFSAPKGKDKVGEFTL